MCLEGRLFRLVRALRFPLRLVWLRILLWLKLLLKCDESTMSGLRRQIQLASHLRTHLLPTNKVYSLIRPSAPVLALLGDIGLVSSRSTQAFIEWANKNFESVFWIPGATEYSSSFDTQWTEAAFAYYDALRSWDACRVYFCQNQDFFFSPLNTRILATTGYFPPVPPAPLTRSRGYIEPFAEYDYTHISRNELLWIEKKLSYPTPSTETVDPILLLTYGPILSQTARMLFPSAHATTINTQGLFANLYGTTESGVPTTSSLVYRLSTHVNMANHLGFQQDYTVQIPKMQ